MVARWQEDRRTVDINDEQTDRFLDDILRCQLVEVDLYNGRKTGGWLGVGAVLSYLRAISKY